MLDLVLTLYVNTLYLFIVCVYCLLLQLCICMLCACTHTHICIDTYIHTYVHTYIRTYIHTYIDVKGAFDADWWPAILRGLREAECPRNLYQLTQDYFKNRRAVMLINNRKIEKSITKGCPQGSYSGPGFWIIQYNFLFNIQFTHHTKVTTFADGLVIMTTAESIPEAENIMNVLLSKIADWARENKLQFNEQKSQVVLMTRRKERKRAS